MHGPYNVKGKQEDEMVGYFRQAAKLHYGLTKKKALKLACQ